VVQEEDNVVRCRVETLHVTAHEDVRPSVVELQAVLRVLVRHQDLLVRVARQDQLNVGACEQNSVCSH
jgi:hypothetical protein